MIVLLFSIQLLLRVERKWIREGFSALEIDYLPTVTDNHDGYVLEREAVGRMFDNSFPACAFVFVVAAAVSVL